MGRLAKWFMKTVLGLLGIVIVFMLGGFALLNTSWLQGKLLDKAVTLLTDKLQTRVEIDSVSIDLLTLDAKLYGLMVEDRQQRKMLQMDYLKADVDILRLMTDEIRISEAKIEGLHAELYKLPRGTNSPDTIANYQFVIDAFKSDKQKKAPAAQPDSVAPKKGKKLALVMDRVTAERIDVKYNQYAFSLGKLDLSLPKGGLPNAEVEQLQAQWSRTNKKGWLVDHQAVIERLSLYQRDSLKVVEINRLHFSNNNHHPRKNSGKPKRGFFDAEHFNLWANLSLEIDHVAKDSIHGRLVKATARDTIMGIDIRDLHSDITFIDNTLHLRDFLVRQINTTLQFDRAVLHLPNKKLGTKFTYSTSTIKGHTILKDISRPFAPVLRNFSLPVDLRVRMEGDAEIIRFHDAVVTRPNNMLLVKAKGFVTGLKDKYQLNVHFDIDEATIKGGEKERLINQFVVKKFMMKQLHALGTLHIRGGLNVRWKKEEFMGVVNTQAGTINFNFALDELNKYVFGKASAKHLELGKVMDMPDIGPVSATADFKFDISKPRTAIMRRKLGGKLPIGEVTAHVEEASYKFVKTKNLYCKMVSNGAIAEGMLKAPGSFATLSCEFSFTNTNEMKKTKIKPGLRLHLFDKGKSEEERQLKAQQRAAEKERREAERAQRRAAKAQEAKEKAELKRLRNDEKAARKEREAAEKAARKQKEAEEKAYREQQEAEEKALRKQKKAEEKAARRAAKAAEKAARRAAKEAAKNAE